MALAHWPGVNNSKLFIKCLFCLIGSSFWVQSTFALGPRRVVVPAGDRLIFDQTIEQVDLHPSLKSQLSRDLKVEIDPAIYNELIAQWNRHATSAPSPQFITNTYLNLRSELERENSILNYTGQATKLGLNAGIGAATETFGGGLAVKFIAKVTDAAVDEVITALKTEQRKRYQILLADALDRYRTATGDSAFSRLIGKDPKKIYQILKQRAPLFSTLKPEQLNSLDAVLIQDAQKTIETAFANEVALRDFQAQYMNDEIQKNRQMLAAHERQIGKIYLTFQRFAEQTKQNFETLAAASEALATKLAEVEKRGLRNSADIQFLENFLFSKGDPKAQLELLNSGHALNNLSPAERERLKTDLELQKLKMDVISTSAQILDGAGAVVQIASQLGVDPAVVKGLSTGVKVASGMLQIFSGIASENPLQVITGIASIFGAFGSDAGETRHREIMEALAGLARGQEAILKNQERILNALGNVQRQLARIQAQVENLQEDVLVNRRILAELLNRDLNSCAIFAARRADFGFVNGLFPSYAGLVRHFAENRGDFEKCHRFVTQLLEPLLTNGELSETFRLATYAGGGLSAASSGDDARVLQGKVNNWNDVMGLFKALVEQGVTTNGAIGNGVLLGTGRFNALQYAAYATETGDSDSKNTSLLMKALSSPVASAVAAQVAEYAIMLHPYLSVIDLPSPNLQPPSAADLRRSGGNKRGAVIANRLLAAALRIVEISIAQERALTGDGVIQWLDRAISYRGNHTAMENWKLSPSYAPQSALALDYIHHPQNRAFKILRTNPLIARNYARFLFWRTTDSAKQQQLLGAYQPTGDVEIELSKTLGIPLTLVWAEDKGTLFGSPVSAGYSLAFAGEFLDDGMENRPFYIPVPRAETYALGELEDTKLLRQLNQIRQTILDELAGYRFMGEPKTYRSISKTFIKKGESK